MSELQRYGLEWKSDTDFIATPMSDGYWTPWHIAQERLTTTQAENEALRAKVDLFRRACEDVLDGRPFEQAFILRKQAEAVEVIATKLEGMNLMRPDEFLRLNAERLRTQAAELDNKI